MKDSNRVSLALADADYRKIGELADSEGISVDELVEGLLRAKLLEVCKTNAVSADVTHISKGLKRGEGK